MNTALHEYSAIRGEVLTTLNSQVSILSFGAATVGLLASAAATLWEDAESVAGLLLLFAVPLVCFLTLAIYSGELMRLLRAGLFLNRLENDINATFPPASAEPPQGPTADADRVLCWEGWDEIRQGSADIDKLNRLAISAVFLLLAVFMAAAGCFRLFTSGFPWFLAVLATAVSVSVGGLSLLWLVRLGQHAYAYRWLYEPAPARSSRSAWRDVLDVLQHRPHPERPDARSASSSTAAARGPDGGPRESNASGSASP